MRANRIREVLLLFLLAALPSWAVAADEDQGWSVELGTKVTYHDNFFYRSDDDEAGAPSATFYSLYTSGEYLAEVGKGELTFLFDAAGMVTEHISGADRAEGGVGLEYKRKRTRVSGGYDYQPNRLYSESPTDVETGDEIFYDLQAAHVQLRQKLTRGGIWVGAKAELQDWSFDPQEDARDADAVKLKGTIRFPLGTKVGLRASYLYETKDADSDEYDWDADGYEVALEINPHERVSLFLRYKDRDRDYEDAPADDNNFEREDSIQDLLLNLRVRLGESWGLQLENFYRDGESTREDRNYDANRTALGFFYSF
jgi:hypothetical protein